jgi:hypothetical protein
VPKAYQTKSAEDQRYLPMISIEYDYYTCNCFVRLFKSRIGVLDAVKFQCRAVMISVRQSNEYASDSLDIILNNYSVSFEIIETDNMYTFICFSSFQ